MIKNVVVAIVMLVVIGAGLSVINTAIDAQYADKVIAQAEQMGSVRTVTGVVVTEDSDILTVEDEQGNLWQMVTEEYTIGDSVMVWLADNNTPNNVVDDTIVDVVELITD